jgi:DNA polymerase-4
MSVAATILHADMDAFYAAVEQHDRPELRGKPVIVGGAGKRGVVLTGSYEARAYGVHSAMPSAQAHKLCPHGVFVVGRMWRYAEVAKHIRSIFGEFTPQIEPLSLDEAFLDVTASLRLFGSAFDIAQRLKNQVRAETGLTVSVGIGPSKMIAKIASALSKPDGLLEVKPEDVRNFLRPLAVGQLWGVGPTTQAQLRTMGISTIGELADTDPNILQRRLGHAGVFLWELAHGHDPGVVEPDRERKSYGEEQTFDRDRRDGEEIRRTIAAQAESVAHRLRADARRGRTVTLKLKLAERIGPGKYPVLTRRLTLPAAVNDGKAIASAALTLWDAVKAGKTIRLIGVAVSSIEKADPAQLPLFGSTQSRRQAALNQAVDTITARFGHDVVTRGYVPAKLSRPHSQK